MKKVFIDGKAGTTGLRIYERLSVRSDIRQIVLDDAQRKDPRYRKQALNEADIAFLCLPDDAARESVSLIENPNTVVLDTSTAHRTDPDWTYGFAELSAEQEETIKTSKRIAVPGCHASGFIALVAPLVKAGLLPKDALLTCQSITGYSGGGKKMIEQYETSDDPLLKTPRQYGLSQQHKHLKEMKAVTGLDNFPIFCPVVADFYSGMEVTVGLFSSQLQNGATKADIENLYKTHYQGELVRYRENIDQNGFFAAGTNSGKDSMLVTVAGNDERILLTALYDNLGKGASGAALACLNLVMGLPATYGLDI